MAVLTQALLVHLYLSLILSSFILQPWKNDRDCGEKKKTYSTKPWALTCFSFDPFEHFASGASH